MNHKTRVIDPSGENPYGDQIRNFFQSEFPFAMEKSSSDLIELLSSAIMATGKIRLGPKPSIESQYAIRKTIKAKIDAGVPIPFLMPWGSEKPRPYQIVDLAEVVAFKQIICLDQRVSALYGPGIEVRIRVENATAPSLFYDRKEQARENARIYTDSLTRLNQVLDSSHFVKIVPEDTMVSEYDFNSVLAQYQPRFEKYLNDTHGCNDEQLATHPALNDLKETGWMGTIPVAQREHYYATYRKLYNRNDAEAIYTLSIYMAQSLVRRKLKMMGESEFWNNDYLGLSFVGPIPGEPAGVAPKRIYYRTIPENLSTFHIAPWRGKGFLALGTGEPLVKLASWNEPRGYHQASVILDNGETTAEVRTDYEV